MRRSSVSTVQAMEELRTCGSGQGRTVLMIVEAASPLDGSALVCETS